VVRSSRHTYQHAVLLNLVCSVWAISDARILRQQDEKLGGKNTANESGSFVDALLLAPPTMLQVKPLRPSIAKLFANNILGALLRKLNLALFLLQFSIHCGCAYLAPTLPSWWEPTYNMTESLITMQLNGSGISSPTRAAEFGIVSYDWSNMKEIWAKEQPMNCEELLLEQAIQSKAAGAKHVWVYRNIVKALPWFKTVRAKLDDPAYAGFFLHFSPAVTDYHVPLCAAENASHCSLYYHDQLQTPQVPSERDPHPDGSCQVQCDCGRHPCGEYVFDHRNGTMLREFLVQEVILPAIRQHPGVVDGLFLDDFWCSDWICEQSNNETDSCPCNDPVQGPTEIDRHWQHDTGLSDLDSYEMTMAWNTTMDVLERVLLSHHSYSWWLMHNQQNANAMPVLLHNCTQQLREACGHKAADSVWQTQAVLFGLKTDHDGRTLVQLEQDLAFFLLARGDYAWMGWGVWGMTWPFGPQPAHGALPPQPDGVPVPEALKRDYGVPEMICWETSTGVFMREYTAASVQLDCNRFEAHIEMRKEKSSPE